jgi:hypothetical protein
MTERCEEGTPVNVEVVRERTSTRMRIFDENQYAGEEEESHDTSSQDSRVMDGNSIGKRGAYDRRHYSGLGEAAILQVKVRAVTMYQVTTRRRGKLR